MGASLLADFFPPGLRRLCVAGAVGAAIACGASVQASAQDALPAEVQFDVLRLEIGEAAKRNLHKDVLGLAERMRKTGQPVPPEISLLEGKAFYGLGALAMARRSIAAYLNDVGRTGKDYDEALRLYVKVKSEIDDKARAQREVSSLRADYEVAHAAWRADRERTALWKKRAVVFGGPGDDSASAIARGPDGGIVIAGALHVRKTQDDRAVDAVLPWITAFNRDGKRIWHRPLGAATDAGSLRSIAQSPGKGFVFGGVQKGFQIAALTDGQGNLASNGDGDPWVMAFAPSAGEGGIARLLHNGEIVAVGAENIGKDADSGKPSGRLPVAVRLSPKGKVLGKYVLARGAATRWYDVKDVLALESGDLLIAGETRANDGDSSSAEGYLIRMKPDGREVWTQRFPASREGGAALTAVAAGDGAIFAVGRDGAELAYARYSPDGKLVWRRSRGALATPAAFSRFCATDALDRLRASYRAAASKKAGSGEDPLADYAAVRAFACHGGKGFAAATTIVARVNGFVIFGIAGRDGAPLTRITATAIGNDGSVAWETVHGDGPLNVAAGALPTGDGGFVVAGITNNWGRDMLLFRIDGNGALAPFAALGPAAAPAGKAVQKAAPGTPQGDGKTAPPAGSGDTKDAPERAGQQDETDAAPDRTTGQDGEPAPRQSESLPAPPPSTSEAPQSRGSGEASYDLLDLLGGLFGGDNQEKPESKRD